MHQPTLAQVLSDANLFAAWAKVRDNHGCAGNDGVSIADFEARLLANIATLRDEVHHGCYKPQPLKRIEIPKESGGMRPLSIPTVRDRLIQTAVTLCITPIFEAEFEECSYAYRAGRSVNQAVQRVTQLRDTGYQWVVDADIESFFDEIDHGLLMEQVRRLLVDKKILRLIRQWLKSDVAIGDYRFRMTKGVPQGSPISPMLSNLYLDRLDESFLENDMVIVRFADDFLVLCKNRSKAEAALELTTEVLDELRLSLNDEKTRLVSFEKGFRFLGVDFVRSLAIKRSPKKRQGGKASIPKMPDVLEVADEPPWEEFFYSQPATDIMWSAFKHAEINPEIFPQPKPQIAESTPVENQPVINTPDSAEDDESIAEYENSETVDHDPRLRTLYLTEHNYALGKSSERLTIERSGQILKSIPAIKIDQVVIMGSAQITTQAMQFCVRERIPIYLTSAKGHYYGVVESYDTDAVLLHRDQFIRNADDTFTLKQATAFVNGKLANSRLLLSRLARKRESTALKDAIQRLKRIQPQQAETLDQLRGYEGAAASAYYSAIKALLHERWAFSRRVKRPPTDPVNALFSYGYTILFNNILTLLRIRGLNPHVGFLHAIRPGHPALASDVMEEFRALVVDAVVMNLVLNEKLTPEDFQTPAGPGQPCLLLPKAKAIYIKALETKFNTPLKHPYSGLQLDYRRCMEHQIHQLVAVIRGREPEYKAMVLR